MADTRKETQQKIVSLIIDKLEIKPDEVSQTALLQDLGADSIDRLDFLLTLQETFNLEISDEEAEEMDTENVGQLIDRIHKHIS